MRSLKPKRLVLGAFALATTALTLALATASIPSC